MSTSTPASDQYSPLISALLLTRPEKSESYVPHSPHEGPQTEFLQLDCEEALYGGAAGGGKLLSLETPIPTPSGWSTIGQLKAGGMVFDESGRPTCIEHVYDIVDEPESYRVHFDDGSTIDACAEHRWLTYTIAERAALARRTEEFRARRRSKRPSRVGGKKSELFSSAISERNARHPPPTKPTPKGEVRTTREIKTTLRCRGRTNHSIPVAQPLELRAKVLTLDPYLLGAWLGDGTTRGGSITTADPEILAAFHSGGFATRHYARYTHGIYGLSKVLRQVGVFGDKHVPGQYLRASIEQRLSLLQGLMDTDGHACESGAVEFTSTLRCLADAVAELAVSLGSKAVVREGRATYEGRDTGPKYRVKWSSPYPMFRLKRKLERQRLSGHRPTTRSRMIVDVERIAPRPMRCIRVAALSGLFLAGRSMVPTHNSDAILMGALQYVHVPGYAALILRKTYKQLSKADAIMERAKSWLSSTDARWIGDEHAFIFPSGARLEFGHLQYSKDRYNYQGAAYQFIGFDELTQFEEGDYLYLHSRLRKPDVGAISQVPLRVRGASNPGGVGHEWVASRFVRREPQQDEKLAPPDGERLYVPAKLGDNPSINQESYERNLLHLPEAERKMLLNGDWNVRDEGACFREFQWDKNTLEGTRPLRSPYPVVRALDWGYHHWPVLWLEAQHEQVFVFDEWHGQLVTLPAAVEEIRRIDADHGLETSAITTYVDPAGMGTNYQTGVSDIDMLRGNGFSVVGEDERFSRETRTGIIKLLFEKERLWISRDRCPYLVKCLERAVWDRTGVDGPPKNAYKKDGKYDHHLDALGEALVRLFPPTGPASASETVDAEGIWTPGHYSASEFG